MTTSTKAVALAVSSAFVLSIGATTINAAENPFAIKSLSTGYQVAAAEKAKDGKCGEGKCSAEMKKAAAEKAKDGKCGEGKCSAEMKKSGEKATEGKCGADKAKDGSCSH